MVYPWSAGDELPASELNDVVTSLITTLNAGEAINGATLPVASYISTDNEIYACDANDTSKYNFAGFCITNSTDGNPITLQSNGIVPGFSGLTEGANYFVQDDSTIGTTPGTHIILVGIAISATQLLIKKGPQYAAGVATDFSQAAGSGDANYDETITIGFRAKMIKLSYYVQGNTPADGHNQEAGVAVFYNGVLVSNYLEWNQTQSGADNAVPGTQVKSRGTSAIVVGSPNNNQGMELTLTIESVTDTTFVIRKAIDEATVGPGGPARFQGIYEVWG